MIADHIGYFLYPDLLWLRVIGRMAFPLFFLLIGWNGSAKVGRSLIIASYIIQGTLWYLSYTKGIDMRQLNILPAAIITKFVLGGLVNIGNKLIKRGTSLGKTSLSVYTAGLSDLLLEPAKKAINTSFPRKRNPSTVFKSIIAFVARTLLLILFVVIAPFLKEYVEYGTMILATAILGKLIHSHYPKWRILRIPMSICFVGWLMINNAFPFTQLQRGVVCLLWITALNLIRNMTKNNRAIHLGLFDRIILFISKQAVRIYVIHFLFLMSIIFRK